MFNIKNISNIIVIFILYISFSMHYNYKKMKPTNHELILLKKYLNIELKNTNDFLRFQNNVIDLIKHSQLRIGELNLDTIFKYKKGFCYDRSFLMQKAFVYNNIKIRPVYIYYNVSGRTKIYHFLFRGINSHNLFEIYYQNEWLVIETNKKQNKLLSLEEYIHNSDFLPVHSKYIRHLNNRNSIFISPTFIPDIY